MKKSLFFLLTFITIAFLGCDSHLVDESKEIPNNIWTYENGLDFQFSVADTSKRYNLVLEIDHTTDYPFQNLYLKIVTTYPNGKSVDDILSVDLADKSGRWYGKCNSHNCKTTIDLQKNTFFKTPGKHTITFFQNTRKENLEGVSGLCFRISEVKS